MDHFILLLWKHIASYKGELRNWDFRKTILIDFTVLGKL